MRRPPLVATVVLAMAARAAAEPDPGAAETRAFLDSAARALSMPLRDDWTRLQSPEFQAREVRRATLLLAHAANGNVVASAAVWLATGRRPDDGMTAAEFLQASHPPSRRGRGWRIRFDLPRVEELSVSGGSLEAVIQTVHDRTRIRASWDGKRFLVDDAVSGARPRRAHSPAARTFDRWRNALTLRDGRAMFSCLSAGKREFLRQQHRPPGGIALAPQLRLVSRDEFPIQALDNDLEQARLDPGVDDAILRGAWTLGYTSPTRQVYVAPGLPPVEILLEGRRWIVSTAMEDFLPLPK